MNRSYTLCGRDFFLINHFWLCTAVVSHSQVPEAEIPCERASNALRKVFARPESVFEIRTYFGPTALYLRICLLDFSECLDFFKIYLCTASETSRLLGRFPKNLYRLQTNTPESFQFILCGNFTDYLESFAQYGFLPGNLPDFLEDIQVVWKLSRLS